MTLDSVVIDAFASVTKLLLNTIENEKSLFTINVEKLLELQVYNF
jgi:hypothetical protein